MCQWETRITQKIMMNIPRGRAPGIHKVAYYSIVKVPGLLLVLLLLYCAIVAV